MDLVPHRVRHSSRIGPRFATCGRCNDSQSALQTARGYCVAARHPPRRGSAINDETRADAHKSSPNADQVAALQSDRVEARQRDSNSTGKISLVVRQQRPQVSVHGEIHSAGECAVSHSAVRGVHVERAAQGDGLDSRGLTHESALMKFSELETQPKMPPCALIISSPTRWNSGKYEATQSLNTTHS
jgi:hypothetical protein